MRKLGLRIVLLTGDRKEIADATAKELGVDEVQSELLPDQQVARVSQLRAEGRTVAMVGDGVNDAPALMESNVGIGCSKRISCSRTIRTFHSSSTWTGTTRGRFRCRKAFTTRLPENRGCTGASRRSGEV